MKIYNNRSCTVEVNALCWRVYLSKRDLAVLAGSHPDKDLRRRKAHIENVPFSWAIFDILDDRCLPC